MRYTVECRNRYDEEWQELETEDGQEAMAYRFSRENQHPSWLVWVYDHKLDKPLWELDELED